MIESRHKEEYRQHTILAALHQGVFKGRIWRLKSIVHECEGDSIDELIPQLRHWVDSTISQKAEAQGNNPDYATLLHSFQEILPSLSDGHLAMLKAHYNALDGVITAGELAEAANYANFSAANLQYGLIGKMLQELAPINLPKSADGTDIYTFYLASSADQNRKGENWKWQLRPEVAQVIEHLGLNI